MRILQYFTGADPGFFLGGGSLLRNDVTDRLGKQILKANTKKNASSSRYTEYVFQSIFSYPITPDAIISSVIISSKIPTNW